MYMTVNNQYKFLFRVLCLLCILDPGGPGRTPSKSYVFKKTMQHGADLALSSSDWWHQFTQKTQQTLINDDVVNFPSVVGRKTENNYSSPVLLISPLQLSLLLLSLFLCFPIVLCLHFCAPSSTALLFYLLLSLLCPLISSVVSCPPLSFLSTRFHTISTDDRNKHLCCC